MQLKEYETYIQMLCFTFSFLPLLSLFSRLPLEPPSSPLPFSYPRGAFFQLPLSFLCQYVQAIRV